MRNKQSDIYTNIRKYETLEQHSNNFNKYIPGQPSTQISHEIRKTSLAASK